MRILIIGYGSIGHRHHEVLRCLFPAAIIDVVSSHANGARFRAIEDVGDPSRYDYFIISSETGAHLDQLRWLEGSASGKTILVEKPLFSEIHDWGHTRNNVFVGYNLRFHPLVCRLRQLAREHCFSTVNVVVGQYLPDWRPATDYRTSYSASRARGGGVLLDLSHEIDYIQWMFGDIRNLKAIGGKISTLEIESEDFAAFIGETEQGVRAVVSLDYLSRIPIRRIYANAVDVTCICDLIEGTMRIRYAKDAAEEVYKSHVDRNDTYAMMHRNILMEGGESACTIGEGLGIIRTIGKIRLLMEEFSDDQG